jgi:hypothetical protein
MPGNPKRRAGKTDEPANIYFHTATLTKFNPESKGANKLLKTNIVKLENAAKHYLSPCIAEPTYRGHWPELGDKCNSGFSNGDHGSNDL